MHHNLTPVVLFLLVTTPSFGQDALGRGDLLDASSSLLGRTNALNDLPLGTRNNELRRNGILRGRSFDNDIGRFSSDELMFITDAMNKGGEEAYLEALYNSPWYWNNWDQQSAQFLTQGDISFFNPSFVDDWADSPRQMHVGRSIRSYSHEWDPETAREYGGEGGSRRGVLVCRGAEAIEGVASASQLRASAVRARLRSVVTCSAVGVVTVHRILK